MNRRHSAALVVLLALATNPYCSFYDALLLVVPATAWWTERDTWRRDRWMVVGVLIAVAWCWEQYSYNWQEFLKAAGVGRTPPFSLVGPIAAVWLIVASVEGVRASLAGPHIAGQVRAIVASQPSDSLAHVARLAHGTLRTDRLG